VSYLIYSPNTSEQKIYQLNFGTNTIGRDNDNSIIITDISLSRHHAKVIVDDTQVTIKDNQSTNGTFVNDVRINQAILKENDEIKCGTAIFRFTEQVTRERAKTKPEIEPQQSILKQFSLDRIRIAMQDLLQSESPPNSVLFIRQQDPHQRTVDKLKVLLEISKELCSPEEPEQLLNRVLELLWKVMNIDRAVILMVGEESSELEVKGIKVKPGIKEDSKFYSRKIANLVRTTGDAILTTDASEDERFSSSLTVLQQTIRASMCVPLKPYDEVIGVLYVDSLSLQEVYSEEDLEFLTALANQAAAAIHMAKEFYKREQKLKQEVIELKIQIDQSKKEQQVKEITDSDSFQSLLEKAQKIRQRS
jgi:adenylate cyclase